jgi:hypothetical protein
MKNINKKISEEMNNRLGEKLYETNTTKLNWCKKLLMLELGLASAIKYKLSDLLIENTKL